MNVLITGGGGFIGSHLVDSQLAQGHTVRTVDLHLELLDHVANHPALTARSGSIADQESMRSLLEGVDVVYHLASAHLDVSLNASVYREINVDATLALAKASKAAGVKRFVHCSSVGVIGDVTNPPADETTPCQPTNVYEQTKLAGEQAVIAFAKSTQYPLVVVRPAWVYGPRCPRTERLMRTVKKGRFPIFGRGANWRHPIYIRDAISGFEQAAVASVEPGELFILAGDRPVTINELLTSIAKAQACPPPKLRFPMWLGMLAGHGLQLAFKPLGKQPPFSRRSLDFYLKNNAYSIEKARSGLGFTPKSDLLTGLAETIRIVDQERTKQLYSEAQ